MTDWTLWVRDATRQRIGQVTRWSALTCIQRFDDFHAQPIPAPAKKEVEVA